MNTMRDIPVRRNAQARDYCLGTEPAWYRPAPRDLSAAPAHVVCALHLRWVSAGRPAWPAFPELSAERHFGAAPYRTAGGGSALDPGASSEIPARECVADRATDPHILDVSSSTSAGAASVAPALLGGV